MLIDEYITARMKLDARPSLENLIRVQRLEDAIQYTSQSRLSFVAELTKELAAVLKECWDAQEVIMSVALDTPEHIKQVAEAAIIAQKTNGERNKLIRAIDEILEEADITPQGKTYV
jgi:Mg2+ and Co2+ transporter CorA